MRGKTRRLVKPPSLTILDVFYSRFLYHPIIRPGAAASPMIARINAFTEPLARANK